jgi:acyl dehydratase
MLAKAPGLFSKNAGLFGRGSDFLTVQEFCLEQIRVGHRFKPLIYPISQDVIEKYTQAVDDPNPFYLDRSIAEQGPFCGIIAPPALASLYVLKAYRTDSAPPPGGIHLEQKFAFSGPMHPGDVLTAQAELTRKTQRRGNWYLSFASVAVNQKGETIVTSESTSVWLETPGLPRKDRGSPEERSVESLFSPSPLTSSPFEKRIWHVGEALPGVTKVVTLEKIIQYEEIVGIGNPVHFDEAYAKGTSFGGIIAHGLLNAAYVSEMFMNTFPLEWVHGGEMQIQFTLPLRPRDTVRIEGGLEKKAPRGKGSFWVFVVRGRNQRGEGVVQGKAGFRIPACEDHVQSLATAQK